MVDLTVPVAAPGASQAAGDVRKFGVAIDVATQSADAHAAQMRKLQDNVARATQQAREYDKALQNVNKQHQAASAHGGLASLFPRGFEAMGGRIANAAGLGNISGAGLAAAAATLPVLYMYMEHLGEVNRVLTEHEKELTQARLQGVNASIRAREEMDKQGASSAERNKAAFMSLAASGGENAVTRAKQMEFMGIPGAVEGTADAYRKFSSQAQRERALKIGQEYARLGMGTMAEGIGKLSPFSLDGASDDMLLREMGAVGGVPLSADRLAAMRANVGGSPTAAMLQRVQALQGARSAVETSRIGSATGVAGGDLAATISPAAAQLAERQRKYEMERAALLSEQSSYEAQSRGSFFGGAAADISHALQIYSGTSPLQRVNQLDAAFSAESDPLLRSIADSAAQAAAALQSMRDSIGTRTPRGASQARP